MNLHETQVALQDHILRNAPGIGAVVVGSHRFAVQDRLAVYRHAYRARLIEALQQNYPALYAVLGQRGFEKLALGYIDGHPSRHASIRFYGGGLGQTAAAGAGGGPRQAMLADLAGWEWALAAAFDGPDGVPLPVTALAAVPPAAWPALRFSLHGSLQRITLGSNAIDWWRHATEGGPRPSRARRRRPASWVIWRKDLTVLFRSLSADEAEALDLAASGSRFGEICESIAARQGPVAAPVRAAALLGDWLASGWVTGLDLRR